MLVITDRLDAALKARGFDPLIDRTEIYAFEEWWKRIEALVARADTVVFVLSPDAIISDVGMREVSFAASLNKRFAPIVCRRVDDKDIPEALAKLNFIFFDDAARLTKAQIGWPKRLTPTLLGSLRR
jgi:hypothetical protein